MENSTKSANIGVFSSTCDVRSHQDHLPPVVPTLLIINIVINSIFACMTVIGNILILISLRRTSRVHAASKALYLSLAMADLGVGIFVQPVFVIRLVAARRGLTEVCRLAGNIIDVAGVITVGVSLQTLSVISVDRVLAIHLKIRYREVATANRTRIALLICWCTSTLQGVSFFINTAFYNMYQVVGISFCICVSSISYLIVFRNLRILQNQIQNYSPESISNSSFNIKRYKKSVSTALWVYASLLGCFVPYIPSVAIRLSVGVSAANLAVHWFTVTCLYANSVLNPVLYCWKIQEVRDSVKEIIKLRWSR